MNRNMNMMNANAVVNNDVIATAQTKSEIQLEAQTQQLKPSPSSYTCSKSKSKSESEEEEEEEEEETMKRKKKKKGEKNKGCDDHVPLSFSLSSYVGLSFSVFLGLLPKSYISYVSNLQSRNRSLSLKLLQAEDQMKQMKSRRKEDSKANAKVVEIFATHRNGWQQEEKNLLQQIDASAEEIVHLRTKIADFEKSEAELRACIDKLHIDLQDRDQMITTFLSTKPQHQDDDDDVVGGVDHHVVHVPEPRDEGHRIRNAFESRGDFEFGDYSAGFARVMKIRVSKQGSDPAPAPAPSLSPSLADRAGNHMAAANAYVHSNGFGQDFAATASLGAWSERSTDWSSQGLQYESDDPLFHKKHFVARRESPWKVDGESTGISSKLKLLEQQLLNLDKIGNGELSKLPSVMRKQATRYQSLAGKIDDLCRRMQASDPCEPALSSELRTQRQTEFLLETFRLQQRAIETGQKLTAFQAETVKCYYSDDQGGHAKVSTRGSLNSIRCNFKEIQRNLEIWLARIMGDLEGMLARDGASRVREYYISKYPFIR